VIGTERWPEALVPQALELHLHGLAGIVLQDIVPLLHGTHEMEQGEPNLLAFGGALGVKEAITFVEPAQRVILAIIDGKGEFVIAGHGHGL
jgi:hypothetical protein